MPACPRKEIVHDGEIGVYHCYGRCVRQAWLCGEDPESGKNYDHRRDWIREQERLLAGLFAIEVGFHGEMSNHLHTILRTRPDIVPHWSDEEVVRRWLTISKLTRNKQGQLVPPTEKEIQAELAREGRVFILRVRMSSISWFMKALRENIAIRANAEDEVTGSFWDGRFKCRSLEDEASILLCGLYVDLNQIRAGEVSTPEESTHTSAYDRILGRRMRLDAEGASPAGGAEYPDSWLAELTLKEGLDASAEEGLTSQTAYRASDKGMLSLDPDDYLQLLDCTGREIKPGKPGAIPEHLAPIFERLQIKREAFPDAVVHFNERMHSVVGRPEQIRAAASRAGRRWRHGIAHCAKIFS